MFNVKKALKVIFILLLLFLALNDDKSYSQSVQVTAGDVTDSRSTKEFFSGLEVEIKVIGDEVVDIYGIREIKIQTAVDNAGRSLIKDENGYKFFNRNKNASNILKKEIKLKNPSRAANSIKSLKGYIELFNPALDSSSKLISPNFISDPGKSLLSNKLSNSGIEIIYLTKEIYEQKKEEFEQSKQGEMDQLGEALGDAFTELFKGLFNPSLTEDKNALNFLVKDDEKKIVDIQFVDSQGNEIKKWGSSRMGNLHTYSFQEAPPVGAQLVVYVATPKSLKKVPFNLTNIPLP